MPESKKGKRSYNAPLSSQVTGVRLVRQQRPAHSQADARPNAASGEALAGGIQPPEPELVSKLIDFIKKI